MKKQIIKEIESPNLLIEIDNRRYALLCEFQDKTSTFQSVYVQENGKDVIIEVGKDSAVVGLFSVEDGKAKQLFDYIEASLPKKDGFVCYSDDIAKHLFHAIDEGGKYPLISNEINGEDRLPLFYRPKRLDKDFLVEIIGHTVTVEHIVDASGQDIDDELYVQEYDDEFELPPKVNPAATLPEGWNWVDYVDSSGHLEGPDGKTWLSFDAHSSFGGRIEYKHQEREGWETYFGKLDNFKENVERNICEHVLKNIEGEKHMDKLKFYVIDDMKKAFDLVHFGNISSAFERFQVALQEAGAMPALGIQTEDGSIDLLHGVSGEAVLVPDYRDMSNFSEAMKLTEGRIHEVVRWLVFEAGGISYEYQNSMMPAWVKGDIKVLVPVTLGDEPKSSYCNGKVLKATQSSGVDAIDSLYIENHGWVAFNELLKHTKEYAPEGFIKVPQLNVVYVREKNVVGIDGRMDIAPHDFAAMVNQINKPYSLVAYDKQDYLLQYKDKHEFIFSSYDNVPDALEGMSNIRERTCNIPLIVQSRDSGHLISSYNGKKVEEVLDAAVETANKRNIARHIKESMATDEHERELS